MGAIRIGCSGWTYDDWRGAFYPDAVRRKDWLAYYSTQFDTTEINSAFYRLPAEETVIGWAEQAPEGFVFAWKVSRYITHNKKLKDCQDSVDLVFSRMQPLGAREGPALVQLPPVLHRDDERLKRFLSWLPPGRRVTVEFRHDSWYDEAVYSILRDHGVAFCVSDHHDAPSPWLTTANFAYVRGHGPGGRYRGRYPRKSLDAWATWIAEQRSAGRDVYGYFDNDVKNAAPKDATLLKSRLKSLLDHKPLAAQ